MPATRADLLAFLAQDHAIKRFAERYEVELTDTPDGLAAVLDKTARILQYSDLIGFSVADSDVLKAVDVAKYFALETFFEVSSLQADEEVDVPRQVRKNSQKFSQLGRLLARYELKMANYGIDVGSPQAKIEVGRLLLDYLEPTRFIGPEVEPL